MTGRRDWREEFSKWARDPARPLGEREIAERLIAEIGPPEDLVRDLGPTPAAAGERLRALEREDPREFERVMEELFASATEKAAAPLRDVDMIPEVLILRAYGSVVTLEALRARPLWIEEPP